MEFIVTGIIQYVLVSSTCKLKMTKVSISNGKGKTIKKLKGNHTYCLEFPYGNSSQPSQKDIKSLNPKLPVVIGITQVDIDFNVTSITPTRKKPFGRLCKTDKKPPTDLTEEIMTIMSF